MQHPEMLPYAVPWLLVNRRLKAEGRLYLLPELQTLVLQHLNEMVTPLWVPIVVKPRKLRFERALTGMGRFNRRATGTFPPSWEDEGTGSDPDSYETYYTGSSSPELLPRYGADDNENDPKVGGFRGLLHRFRRGSQ